MQDVYSNTIVDAIRHGLTSTGRPYTETRETTITRVLESTPSNVAVRLIDRKGFYKDQVIQYPAPPRIELAEYSFSFHPYNDVASPKITKLIFQHDGFDQDRLIYRQL